MSRKEAEELGELDRIRGMPEFSDKDHVGWNRFRAFLGSFFAATLISGVANTFPDKDHRPGSLILLLSGTENSLSGNEATMFDALMTSLAVTFVWYLADKARAICSKRQEESKEERQVKARAIFSKRWEESKAKRQVTVEINGGSLCDEVFCQDRSSAVGGAETLEGYHLLWGDYRPSCEERKAADVVISMVERGAGGIRVSSSSY